MLPGLVLDTTGPNHLSVRETVEMADRRTASAAVRSARRNLYSACCGKAPLGGARTALGLHRPPHSLARWGKPYQVWMQSDVREWHLADIDSVDENVRFRGKSRPQPIISRA